MSRQKRSLEAGTKSAILVASMEIALFGCVLFIAAMVLGFFFANNKADRKQEVYRHCVETALRSTLKPGEYTAQNAELAQQVVLAKSAACLLVQQ